MSIKVVTTCNKDAFNIYGERFLSGWRNWPSNATLHFYTEGFSIPEKYAGVVQTPITKLSDLQLFKIKHSNYLPPSYLYDVVKFSHKVFAVIDALYMHKGIGVWLDADCVTYKKIPQSYIESLLPSGTYLSCFKRIGMPTETGMWVMNCDHSQHQSFLTYWSDIYTSGSFKSLSGWTDCETLDATIKHFESAGLIKTHSLSDSYEKEMHPMAKVDIAKYIDHCKGHRKISGCSPENKYHYEYLVNLDVLF